MICYRILPRPLLRTLQLRHVSHGDVTETSDRRKVFYNNQRKNIRNLKMVKELEVPNYEANPEKPGRGSIERFVPRTKTVPVKAVAPTPDQVPTHRPFDSSQYNCQGNLMWKKEDGCVLCNNNISVSYKNVALLYQFVSNSGRMIGPQKTGLCHMSHQVVTDCIADARNMGLMAYDYKPLEYQHAGVFSQPGHKDAGY